MSFIGCIATLMKASGVDVLLTAAFGGVAGIITGKSWTNAMRAYRLITTVLLQDFFQSGAKTYQELIEYLEAVREHPVGRLWVDCLIKPTLLALQLLRAQRDGDFLLQQVSLEEMMPYFFAAGHMNYARYITWYLRNVENLPTTAKNDLMEGAHACRHSDGGTAVPADQFGEQTYIRRGKGAGGLRGISTNAEQVAVWVGSFSVCAHLDLAIEAMYCHEDAGEKPFGGTEGECKMENKHKEEGERRRKMDETDRNKIAEELEKNLPPTDNNLQLHVLRAHLQMMLWKAADQRHPPVDTRDIRRFGSDVKEGGIVTPSVSNAPVAPQGLLDVVSCSCSAERKACSEKRCSCHSAGLSCTEYCYCEGEMRVAVPSISIQRRINWLKICRKTRERLTMMNDLCIDELLVSTNFCYCWN